jgi:hypothetical protein
MNALWMSHAEWKARELNRLFWEQGLTGKRGQITAETVKHGEKQFPLEPITPIEEEIQE